LETPRGTAFRVLKFFQWDFSGMKNFPVTEKIKVQFRGDLFNILNHPNFGNPGNMGICTAISSTTATSTCSGGRGDRSGR
jgi:hypothetical protein